MITTYIHIYIYIYIFFFLKKHFLDLNYIYVNVCVVFVSLYGCVFSQKKKKKVTNYCLVSFLGHVNECLWGYC